MSRRYVAAVTLCLLLSAPHACTKQEAKTVATDVIRVAVELCQEEAGSTDVYVALACEAGDAVAHVFIPRRQWHAMRAASVDGGI